MRDIKIVDVVRQSCYEAINLIKNISGRKSKDYTFIKLKFTQLVLSDLSDKLLDENFKFSDVYNTFYELYLEEFSELLLSYSFGG